MNYIKEADSSLFHYSSADLICSGSFVWVYCSENFMNFFSGFNWSFIYYSFFLVQIFGTDGC